VATCAAVPSAQLAPAIALLQQDWVSVQVKVASAIAQDKVVSAVAQARVVGLAIVRARAA
jgi:hypothetical protein